MKTIGRLIMFSVLSVLAACGGGGGGGSASIAGTYSGEFVIANSSPFVSESVTFTIDAGGRLTGTTTGGPPAGPPAAGAHSAEPSPAPSSTSRWT